MMDVRWSEGWTSGGLVTPSALGNVCQVSSVAIKCSGHVSPSGDNWRIIWKSDVCPGIGTGLENFVQAPRLVKTEIE